MANLATNTEELQKVLNMIENQVVDISQLETANKTVIGAINELNGVRVDKIDEIDTWYNDHVTGVSTDEDTGFSWTEKFGIYANGDVIAEGDIYHKVPLVAGENINIVESEGNTAAVINASINADVSSTTTLASGSEATASAQWDANNKKINFAFGIPKGSPGESVTITNVDQKTGAGETSTVIFSDGKSLSIKNGTNGGKGDPGDSITITNLSQSNSAGGTSIVTFSDGNTLNIKNGSNGGKGDPGTSVTVSSVSESTADGGSNVVTFSDGKTLTVKNGNKGEDGDIGYYIKATIDRSFNEANWATYGTVGHQENWSNTSNAGFRDGDLFLIAGTASDSGKGHLIIYSFFKDTSTRTTLYGTCIGHHIISAKGADGKTPVKGTDYFTSTEIDNIATQAAGKVVVVDEKVKTTARANTDTHYLTGASGATTGGLKYDSSVHFGTESGELCMKSCNLNTSENPAKLVYDDTKKAIKFIFN